MTKRRLHAEPVPRWTAIEEEVMRLQYPHMKTRVVAAMLGITEKRAYNKAKAMRLTKSPEFLASPASGRTTGRQGIGTRFEKGHSRSWNKGLHYVAGGRSAETRFRKGQMPHNWKTVGSTRINSEGYRDIKIDDKAKGPRAWVAIHRLNWIAANGPIPKDHILRFIDRNPLNALVENLLLVTREENLRLNWHDRYPKSIKQLVQLRGAIQRQINRRTQREQD